VIVNYEAITRDARASVARIDALVARLRRTQQLVIGRTEAEMRADRIAQLHERELDWQRLVDTLQAWSRVR
jgi:hypothetical protein